MKQLGGILALFAFVMLVLPMAQAAPIDITVNSPTNSTYLTYQNIPVNVGFNETVNSTWLELDGGILTSGTNVTSITGSITPLAAGQYNFTAFANDSSGVVYSETVLFSTSLPATGISRTLNDAGSGLGGFLTAIQDPVINIVLALGIIGGILAIFYGIASVIKRSVSGASQKIGA